MFQLSNHLEFWEVLYKQENWPTRRSIIVEIDSLSKIQVEPISQMHTKCSEKVAF